MIRYNLYELFAASLIVWRIALVVAVDLISEPLRKKMVPNLNAGHSTPRLKRRLWIAQLVSCVDCVSVWIAAGFVLLYWRDALAWGLVRDIVAVAGGALILERVTDHA